MNIFRKYKTIEEMLPDFMLSKEGAVTKTVYGTYLCHIRILIEWLKDNHIANQPMKKITEENIRDFFHYIWRERHLDRGTCEKYFLHNRLLFKYAQKRGEIDTIPFDLVVLPRQEKDQGAEVISAVHLNCKCLV